MKLQVASWAGSWAVVTGASSGIGREFAVRLAGLGMNVVAVARNGIALHELALQLESAHGTRVIALELDLRLPLGAELLRSRIEELTVGRLCLVVNNAGVGSWGPFDPGRAAEYREMVQLNTMALLGVTAALLPALKQGAPSALINVSSQAAYQPVPYMAVYGATKAFVQSFSQAIFEEVRASGVLVQTLIPAPTETDFDRRAGAYESAVVKRSSPQAVVDASLTGLERGHAVVGNATGIWRQRLFAALFHPEFVVRQVAKMFRPPPS